MWINIIYKNKDRKLINLDGAAYLTIEHSDSRATLYVGFTALLTGSPSYMENLYGKILLAMKAKETLCNIYEEGALK